MSAGPLFGPGWGNYAIQGIVELSLPDPVALYPQTPGWWLLLGAFALSVAWAMRRRQKRWRRDRYRREALRTLNDIRDRLARGDRTALRDLAPLLRATALAAGDRTQLTTLTGQDWFDAVNAMAPDLAPLPVAELERLAYVPLEDASVETGDSLIEPLAAWINGHGASHA